MKDKPSHLLAAIYALPVALVVFALLALLISDVDPYVRLAIAVGVSLAAGRWLATLHELRIAGRGR